MSYKILFADDEYWIREKMKTIIQWEEYDFEFLEPAKDGREVLVKIDENPPEILITDIDMPFINGVELIKKVKQAYKDIVVVVISGYDDFAYVKETLKDGAIDYLLKPIKKINLINVLTGALELISVKEENLKKSLKAASLIQDWEMSYYLNNKSRSQLIDKHNSRVEALNSNMILIKVHKLNNSMDKFHYDINELSFYVKNLIKEVDEKSDFQIFNNIYRSNEFIVLVKEDKEFQHFLAIKILKHLNNHMDSPVSIMISERTYSVDNLNTAYVQCMSLLMQRQFNDKSIIVESTNAMDDNNDKIRETALTQEYKNHLLAYLVSKNKDAIDQLIFESMGLQASEKSEQSFLYIKQTVKRLFTIFTEYMFSVGRDEDGMEIENMLELAEQYVDSLNMEGLIEEINELIDLALSEVFVDSSQGTIRQMAKLASEYIHTHYYEKLTLTTLSEKYNVESSYFSRVFREVLGDNLITYIAKVRIDKAIELMENPQNNMAEIAYMVGYADYTYFSKVFKKVTGSSPRTYKSN